ncbi:hypothetical protein P4B35_01070 [Pontiellaceae bacterium B12227]|nr:hypothetical protein [Pontiellaceae bacterium B12227]
MMIRTVIAIILLCAPAFGANYVYQGGGVAPNDWFDDANWSDAGGAADWPTATDNALFMSASGMTIHQAVPMHGQLQAGRGATNAVTIAAGGAMTNSNQTVVGIVDNGEGHLVVDGGSLVTKALRLNVFGGATVLSPGSSVELRNGTIHVDASFGGANAGDIDLGLNESASFRISGGMLTVDNNLDFTAGLLELSGAGATVEIGGEFGLGTASASRVAFELDGAGAVSTIFANTFSLQGSIVLEVDASAATCTEIANLVLMDLGDDTFSAEEFSMLSNALVAVNISNESLSLSNDRSQLLFSGTVARTHIVSAVVDDGVMQLEVGTSGDAAELSVVASTNLTSGWRPIAYSTNAGGRALCADLSGAPMQGSNRVVYVPADGAQAFFGIEHAPLEDWFVVAAENDPSLTTHTLSSGDFELGVSDFGGGYINRLALPGIGDVMGFQADRYGRGGQSAIRDDLHGKRYNPTQAGFSDPAGTVCRVLETLDNSALVVAPRPCCLYRGDGQFDFTEWENLANDGYAESGGSNDWDSIDESLLSGRQATEITSEFDYYCTYEVCTNATGFRHYYEYRFMCAIPVIASCSTILGHCTIPLPAR